MAEVACFCAFSSLFTSLEKDSYRFFEPLSWAGLTKERACSVLPSWATYLSTAADVLAVLFPRCADWLNVSPAAPTRAAANVTAKLQKAAINILRTGLYVITVLLLLGKILICQLSSAVRQAYGRSPSGHGGGCCRLKAGPQDELPDGGNDQDPTE